MHKRVRCLWENIANLRVIDIPFLKCIRQIGTLRQIKSEDLNAFFETLCDKLPPNKTFRASYDYFHTTIIAIFGFDCKSKLTTVFQSLGIYPHIFFLSSAPG